MKLEVLFTEKIFRIALVGEKGVGKTTLIQSFMTGQFSDKIRPTIGLEISMRKFDSADGQNLTLQFWDRGQISAFGSERFPHVKNADLVLLCIDSSDHPNPEIWDAIFTELKANLRPQSMVALIYCKMDQSNPQTVSNLKHWAIKHDFAFFMETSAKKKRNITELFEKCSEWCRLHN